LGYKCLEGRFAVKKPAGKLEDQCRARSQQYQQRINEGIGLDQSAVEIDTQRPEVSRCGFQIGDRLVQPFTSSRLAGSLGQSRSWCVPPIPGVEAEFKGQIIALYGSSIQPVLSETAFNGRGKIPE
jgi:hypothetical protein